MQALSDKQPVELIDKAINNYGPGSVYTLSGAIGYLLIGRKIGWRVMFFVHSQWTVRAYERVLGIKSQDLMPQIGVLDKTAVVYQAVQKVSNFW